MLGGGCNALTFKPTQGRHHKNVQAVPGLLVVELERPIFLPG